MVKIECWRDIDLDLGRFRIGLDAGDRVYTGWHQLGPIPTGGREVPDLRPDLVDWILAIDAGSRRPPPRFRLPDGPPFYRACWRACRDLPAGRLWTYRDLAVAAGRPDAARAAGSAMRHNPTPLLVPCHRILPASGGPGGFAGRTAADDPAVDLKRNLLKRGGYSRVVQPGGGILLRPGNGLEPPSYEW